MPRLRCRYYNNDGTPYDGGCRRINSGCLGVHPGEDGWDSATPSLCRHYSNSGDPIDGGCRARLGMRCRFIHPDDPLWAELVSTRRCPTLRIRPSSESTSGQGFSRPIFVKCKFFDDDGRPLERGCPGLSKGSCRFIHPSDTSWNDAPRKSYAKPTRGGNWGSPRDSTPSNSASSSGWGALSKTAGLVDSGWGSRSGRSTFGADQSASTSTSGWDPAPSTQSTGWGPSNAGNSTSGSGSSWDQLDSGSGWNTAENAKPSGSGWGSSKEESSGWSSSKDANGWGSSNKEKNGRGQSKEGSNGWGPPKEESSGWASSKTEATGWGSSSSNGGRGTGGGWGGPDTGRNLPETNQDSVQLGNGWDQSGGWGDAPKQDDAGGQGWNQGWGQGWGQESTQNEAFPVNEPSLDLNPVSTPRNKTFDNPQPTNDPRKLAIEAPKPRSEPSSSPVTQIQRISYVGASQTTWADFVRLFHRAVSLQCRLNRAKAEYRQARRTQTSDTYGHSGAGARIILESWCLEKSQQKEQLKEELVAAIDKVATAYDAYMSQPTDVDSLKQKITRLQDSVRTMNHDLLKVDDKFESPLQPPEEPQKESLSVKTEDLINIFEDLARDFEEAISYSFDETVIQRLNARVHGLEQTKEDSKKPSLKDEIGALETQTKDLNSSFNTLLDQHLGVVGGQVDKDQQRKQLGDLFKEQEAAYAKDLAMVEQLETEVAQETAALATLSENVKRILTERPDTVGQSQVLPPELINECVSTIIKEHSEDFKVMVELANEAKNIAETDAKNVSIQLTKALRPAHLMLEAAHKFIRTKVLNGHSE